MDTRLFREILEIDSTTSREGNLADFLAHRLADGKCKVEVFEVPSLKDDCPPGCSVPKNLLFSWGEPKVVFCTHLDTVPPYISPVSEEDEEGLVFKGRGTCDAKGQIFSMYSACRKLADEGLEGFALLLLAAEETGSFGAKAFREQHPGAEYVIVGEPTDNCMVSASKGTKAFEVSFKGKSFHSGYPEYGLSAVEMFSDFMNALRSVGFPQDPVLGNTTFNVGRLISDNPQNILSEKLTCRVYFRTTFASDVMVGNVMKNMAGENARLRFGQKKVQDGSDLVSKDVAPWQKSMTVVALGGDEPMEYLTLDGFPVKTVAFGSDAPQLTNFRKRILCGPGSILVAHRPEEHIRVSDMEKAKENYVNMFKVLTAASGQV